MHNLKQINEWRASQGLAPMLARKNSQAAQRKQRANQQARAAADKASIDKRGRAKGK